MPQAQAINSYTQGQKIIEYMKRYGSITPMDAFHKLNITKLSTRIGELEARNQVKVTRLMETSENSEGVKSRYMRYFLNEN